MTEPQPLYCEQPMVYVLSYTLEMVRRLKQNQKRDEGFFDALLRTFNETFRKFASAEDFLRERDVIKQNMKKNGNGYEIIYNPLNF